MTKWTTANIPRQDGKLAIVTGANSGIGLHAARELARVGCTVIVACRSMEKASRTRQRIVQEIPSALVEDGVLDLASLSSIREFAKAFLATQRPLDLLVNNAGVMALPKRVLTADGFELQIGTNHLGHFALTGLLLPALMAAPSSRIVTVSSLAHRGGKIRFDDLNWEHGYKPWPAYRQSKLANLLFGKELERRLLKSGSRTQSIVVHPGVSKTSLFSNGPGSGGGLMNAIVPVFIGLLGQSEEQGALPTLYGATATGAQGGQYYGPDGFREMKGNPVEVNAEAQANDPALAAGLWDLSEKLTGVRYDFSAASSRNK